MIWFTSDWHLFHKNILIYEYRPFKNTAVQTNELIKNFNKNVSVDDTTYFLGDIFWGSNFEQAQAVAKNLNGTKILILGNHDNMKPFVYIDMGFRSVHTSLVYDNISLVHDPAAYGVFRSFSYLDGIAYGSFGLCGHVHSLFKFLPEKRILNVGVDVWDYRPVSENIIRKYIEDNE